MFPKKKVSTQKILISLSSLAKLKLIKHKKKLLHDEFFACGYRSRFAVEGVGDFIGSIAFVLCFS